MKRLRQVPTAAERIVYGLIPSALLDDDDQAPLARTLIAMAVLNTALTLVYAAFWTIIVPQHGGRMLVLLPLALIASGVPLLLIHLGRARFAAYFYEAGTWVFVTAVAFSAGGTRAPIFGLYTLIVMFCVLFSGWGIAVGYVVLTLAAGLIMVVLADQDRIAAPFATPLSAWLTQAAIMFILTAAVYFVVRRSDQALRQARHELAEREKTEVALRESEEKFRAVFELAPYGITIQRKGGVFLAVNRAFSARSGLVPEAVLGKNALDLGMFEDPDSIRKLMKELETSGRIMDREVLFKRPGGHPASMLISSQVIPLAKETIVMTVAVDITERKDAEQALSESEKRYRLISNLISDYAFAYDVNPDGSFKSAWITEDSFTRLTGYTWSEIGSSFKLYHPGDAEIARQHVEQTLRGEAVSGEYRIITKSGETRWIRLNRQPEWDAQGQRVIRFYGAAQDITGRKLAEQQLQAEHNLLEQRVIERTAQLEAANRELEAFAYSVSHDLRAPLRSMDGFSQVLLEEYETKLDAEGQDSLRRIRAATQRMNEMIDALLVLSRISRSDLTLQPLDLSAMAGEIAAALKEADPARQVEVRIQPDVRAQGDARLLRIVLQNLLENAWKYTGRTPQPRIEFGSQVQDDARTVYFVSDNGIGFDMAYADKLFGAFQRLHTDRDFPGTGIGLATVQRVIHRHGGQIWANARENQGAVFYFTL